MDWTRLCPVALLTIPVLALWPAHAQTVASVVPTPPATAPAPAAATGAVPAKPTDAAAAKAPRRFLIDGKLRVLRPGEIRPYVAPVLQPEPTPEPTDIKVIEVDEEEAQVLARPFYGAPMIGNVVRGARLPVRGIFLAKSAHYCSNRRWVALVPQGWLCSKQAHPTDQPKSDASVLQVPPGERLPFHYYMVSSKEPLPLWASAEDMRDGKDPERMLERGDSIAIVKTWKYDGESFYVSAEGKVLAQKGLYAMGPGSAWRGMPIPEGAHLPFGWITPDKGAKVYDTTDATRKLVGVLPRRGRVDILDEVEVQKRRYLRVSVAAVVPGAVPGGAVPGAAVPVVPGAGGAVPVAPAAATAVKAPAGVAAVPGVAAPGAPNAATVNGAGAATPGAAGAGAATGEGAGALTGWVLADEINEVRRQKTPEGVNPVGRWIDVDLGEQVLVAYEGERPVYATLVSSGRSVPTPMGNYPVWAKVAAITMKSQPYDDKAYFVNKVPWSLFFQAHNAIHGAYWHDRFGVMKSHGCVNVAPLDARHLFEWMVPALPAGWSAARPVDLHESPTVHVYNSRAKRSFHQDRPIGPPDRDDEADRLALAEKRRAEQAAEAPPAAPGTPGAPAGAPGAPAGAPPPPIR